MGHVKKHPFISSWENGSTSPSNDTLKELANIFDVSTDYLLGKTDLRYHDYEQEWQYPCVDSRIGKLLMDYRKENGLSLSKFSQKIGISEDLEQEFEIGLQIPSFSMLKKIADVTGYDVDFLLGAVDTTRIPTEPVEIDGVMVSTAIMKSSYDFKSRLEKLCDENKIKNDNCEDFIGISWNVLTDLKYNRMPTLSELLRLSYGFQVSTDYLLGRTDTPITLTGDEQALIHEYRYMNDDSKDIIKGKVKEVIRSQKYEEATMPMPAAK